MPSRASSVSTSPIRPPRRRRWARDEARLWSLCSARLARRRFSTRIASRASPSPSPPRPVPGPRLVRPRRTRFPGVSSNAPSCVRMRAREWTRWSWRVSTGAARAFRAISNSRYFEGRSPCVFAATPRRSETDSRPCSVSFCRVLKTGASARRRWRAPKREDERRRENDRGPIPTTVGVGTARRFEALARRRPRRRRRRSRGVNGARRGPGGSCARFWRRRTPDRRTRENTPRSISSTRWLRRGIPPRRHRTPVRIPTRRRIPVRIPKVSRRARTRSRRRRTRRVSARECTTSLLGAAVDSWDKLRLSAFALLTRHPAPLAGVETAEKLEARLRWALALLRSPRVRESDAAALLVRLLFRKYALDGGGTCGWRRNRRRRRRTTPRRKERGRRPRRCFSVRSNGRDERRETNDARRRARTPPGSTTTRARAEFSSLHFSFSRKPRFLFRPRSLGGPVMLANIFLICASTVRAFR